MGGGCLGSCGRKYYPNLKRDHPKFPLMEEIKMLIKDE